MADLDLESMERIARKDVGTIGRDAILALVARVRELEELDRLNDKLIAERNRVLDAVPCPMHGQCVPHAIETVENLRAEVARLRGEAESLGVERERLEKKVARLTAALRGELPEVVEAVAMVGRLHTIGDQDDRPDVGGARLALRAAARALGLEEA